MLTPALFIDIIFVTIISLSSILVIVSMVYISRIAAFLMDNVVTISDTVSWAFIATYFLTALFFWLFDYPIVGYIICGVLLITIILALLNIIDSFDIVLDLVYSDFFGLFVFIYSGLHIGFSIYFYSTNKIAPAFILASGNLFYFGIVEILSHKKLHNNQDEKPVKENNEEKTEIGPDEIEEKLRQNN